MQKTIIAKIELTPLTPYWRDRLNFFTLHQGKIYSITDDMNLESIREGIDKGHIQLVEGKLPIFSDDDCLSEEEVSQLIDGALESIEHPDCNITLQEKTDILDRIKKLEDGKSDVEIPPVDPEEPINPDQPVDPPEEDKFGTYLWKEEYTLPAATTILDITGSKLIEDYKNDTSDNMSVFYDQTYLAGKYEAYAPRLASKSGVPTTSADDLVDTLIPLGLTDGEWMGEPQVEGAELSNVSPSLVGLTWIYNDASDETLNQIEFYSATTTPVIIYLIKRP